MQQRENVQGGGESVRARREQQCRHSQATPYITHPAPYTLHPTPCTPHPAPYTLHPTPYVDHNLLVPLSSEYGTCKTVKARFWWWLSFKILKAFSLVAVLARSRYEAVAVSSFAFLRCYPPSPLLLCLSLSFSRSISPLSSLISLSLGQ